MIPHPKPEDNVTPGVLSLQTNAIQILSGSNYSIMYSSKEAITKVCLSPLGSTNANKDEQFQSVNVDACMTERSLAPKWLVELFCFGTPAPTVGCGAHHDAEFLGGIKAFKAAGSRSIQL